MQQRRDILVVLLTLGAAASLYVLSFRDLLAAGSLPS
jgi:hypothetical protein